jgi:DNA-binding winged helix-turn-helix (wHTH) protein
MNTLVIHNSGKAIILNEAQKRLLVCLIKNITCKRKIINIVWLENHRRIGDNNYHQLVFQLRALLKQHEIPPHLILTVPYYGIKLNEPLLYSIEEKYQSKMTPNSGIKNYIISFFLKVIRICRSFLPLFLLVVI